MQITPGCHHLRFDQVNALQVNPVHSREFLGRLSPQDTALRDLDGLGFESTFTLKELKSLGIEFHLSKLCTPCMRKRYST